MRASFLRDWRVSRNRSCYSAVRWTVLLDCRFQRELVRWNVCCWVWFFDQSGFHTSSHRPRNERFYSITRIYRSLGVWRVMMVGWFYYELSCTASDHYGNYDIMIKKCVFALLIFRNDACRRQNLYSIIFRYLSELHFSFAKVYSNWKSTNIFFPLRRVGFSSLVSVKLIFHRNQIYLYIIKTPIFMPIN